MATLWENDHQLMQLVKRELFTAVVGDVMDQVGLVSQFLPPQIRPLDPDMMVFGRAMTVLEEDLKPIGPAPKPFGLMLEALDDLKEGEVYICSGSSPTYALWGELMSLRAQKLGSVGAVVDGYSRDTPGILHLGFPVFSHGCYAQDQAVRGHVVDFRVPIQMGATRIAPGDFVFGDIDGVCVIPYERHEEVFEKALEKVRGEQLVREAIQNGLSACDAFEKYGIM